VQWGSKKTIDLKISIKVSSFSFYFFVHVWGMLHRLIFSFQNTKGLQVPFLVLIALTLAFTTNCLWCLLYSILLVST